MNVRTSRWTAANLSLVAVIAVGCQAVSAQPAGCSGDVDGDAQTSFSDVTAMIANFGLTGVTREQGDLNGDLRVDVRDLALLAIDFGCDARSTWSLSDRIAGTQISNFARRWSVAWLLVDQIRLAEPRPDLGGLVCSSGPGGRLVLRYTGQRPELEVWGNELRVGEPAGTLTVIEDQPGRLVFETQPEMTMLIRTTEPAENFVLTPIQYESTHQQLVWHPALVEKVRAGPVLRATHLTQTNWWYADSPTAPLRWEDRSLPDAKLQSGRFGIAFELLADLANRSATDLWVNVPERADDAYVRNLATAINSTLDPTLRVFVECGNEVWNAIPPYLAQSQWMTAEAARRGLFQDLNDDYAAALMMHALRTVEMGRVFESVMGDERVVIVLAQQVGLDYFHDLAAQQLTTGQVADVEALAIAPYFGHSAAALLGVATDDAVFQALEASLDETIADIQRSGAAAQRHGWPMIAYEGGQDMLAPGGFSATDASRLQLRRINEDPRMGDLYRRWLNAWSAAGGGLMMHYGLIYQQDGVWGAWGLFDRTDQGPTEKSRALYEWSIYPSAPRPPAR